MFLMAVVGDLSFTFYCVIGVKTISHAELYAFIF